MRNMLRHIYVPGVFLALVLLFGAPDTPVPVPTVGGQAHAMYGVEDDTEECIRRSAELGLPSTSCYGTAVGRNNCRAASYIIGGALVIGGAGTYVAGRIAIFILGGIGAFGCST